MDDLQTKKQTVEEKLIIALDYDNLKEASALVERLGNSVCIYKVGLEIFLRTNGGIIDYLHKENKKVFLDLKFHDITNTVLQSCAYAAEQSVFMFNVHCANGKRTLDAVSSLLREKKSQSLCIGVTILTNLSEADLKLMYGGDCFLCETVESMADLVQKAGLHGIVCSAGEVASVKKRFGQDFITVCPGIRPVFEHPQEFSRHRADDQSRVMSPYDAVKSGADYVVIGRPVSLHTDPVFAVQSIFAEIERAMHNV